MQFFHLPFYFLFPHQEKWMNSDNFPPLFTKGVWEGFWWAFISMTTVGCVYIIEHYCVDDTSFPLLAEAGRYLT